MNHWSPPSGESRTGSAHQRRGVPCQDATGLLGFLDAGGSSIQVLVVSDGHGGARYSRSDTGSRLACAVALAEVERTLAPIRLGTDPEPWRSWLAEELPERIVQAWRRQVRQHHQEHPGADDPRGFTIPYGATLGVLVLTPAWWGHTGLGDWDLVKIEAGGAGTLVSEEAQDLTRGEATYSLCLEDAARHWRPRCGLHRLSPDDPPFSLLLSTDGIRKSCGSDADFLTLARYLVQLPREQPAELAAALDRISSQGSGDDVSGAVARWAARSAEAERPPAAWIQPARVIQPAMAAPDAPLPLAGGAGGAGGPGPAAARSDADAHRGDARPEAAATGRFRLVLLLAAGGVVAAGLAVLALVRRDIPAAQQERTPVRLSAEQEWALKQEVEALCTLTPENGQAGAGGRGDLSWGAPDVPAAVLPPQGGRQGQPSPNHSPSPTAEAERGSGVSLRSGAATAGGDGPAGLANRPPGAAAPLSPAEQQRRERIRSSLASRASDFQRLANGDRRQTDSLLQHVQSDRLSALIALSALDPSLAPPPPSADAPPGWMTAIRQRLGALLPATPPQGVAPVAKPSPLARLACAELMAQLRHRWQLERQRPTPPPAALPQPGAPATEPAALQPRKSTAAAAPPSGMAPPESGAAASPR